MKKILITILFTHFTIESFSQLPSAGISVLEYLETFKIKKISSYVSKGVNKFDKKQYCLVFHKDSIIQTIIFYDKNGDHKIIENDGNTTLKIFYNKESKLNIIEYKNDSVVKPKYIYPNK